MSESKTKNISERVLIVCNILLVFATFGQVANSFIQNQIAKSQFEANEKLLEIENLKYRQENRPYIYFEQINWIGKYDDLFNLVIKNPGNFPANINLMFDVKDTNGKTIFKDTRENIVLFPYQDKNSIDIGYTTITLKNKLRLLRINNRGVNNILNTLEIDKKITLNIKLEYTSLLTETPYFNKKYTYSQTFIIEKNEKLTKISSEKSYAE